MAAAAAGNVVDESNESKSDRKTKRVKLKDAKSLRGAAEFVTTCNNWHIF